MKYRTMLTMFLAVLGIGLMVFYSWCDTSCSYLKGDIVGIDLKYIGIAYMILVIILGIFKQTDSLRLFLAAGIGVEVFLVMFQLRQDVFCPFCLAFGTIVVVMFILNFKWPRMQDRWFRKILYAAGDAQIPFAGIRMPLIVVMLLGLFFFALTFNGSATPTYGAVQPASIPSGAERPSQNPVFTTAAV